MRLSIDPFRFLGLAFASADLLFEIDERGSVLFAAGASHRLSGRRDHELIGARWAVMIAEADRPLGEALVERAVIGGRRGPVLVRLAARVDDKPRYANLSVFRLPDNDRRISCALTLADPPPGRERSDGGLASREAFEAAAGDLIEAAQNGGADLELGLIELGGLTKQRTALAGAEAEALQRRVVGVLRAEAAGDLATDLGEDRFAIVRRRTDSTETLAQRLGQLLGAAISPKARTFAVNPASDPARMMRALRFALDSFISNDAVMAKAADLSEVRPVAAGDGG